MEHTRTVSPRIIITRTNQLSAAAAAACVWAFLRTTDFTAAGLTSLFASTSETISYTTSGGNFDLGPIAPPSAPEPHLRCPSALEKFCTIHGLGTQ
jgi:hypothetical protein